MAEFCVKCSEKEGQIELLQKQLYETQKHNEMLQSEVDALILDVAFYGGTMINLSCNNK
jgi:hypothetical protein